jgi:Tfp pilus assembly protein PilN
VIRVNLLPLDERATEPRQLPKLPKKGFWISIAAAVAILVPLGGIALIQQLRIASLKADIASAEVEAARLKPQIDRIQTLMKERAEINQRLVTVQGLARDRYLPVQMMDELAVQTPDYLWFTKVNQRTNGVVELEGMTFSNLLVAELMTRMEESDIFQSVELTVSERPKQTDQKVTRFVVTSKIKP